MKVYVYSFRQSTNVTDRQTWRQTDGGTPHDEIGRAMHSIARQNKQCAILIYLYLFQSVTVCSSRNDDLITQGGPEKVKPLCWLLTFFEKCKSIFVISLNQKISKIGLIYFNFSTSAKKYNIGAFYKCKQSAWPLLRCVCLLRENLQQVLSKN